MNEKTERKYMKRLLDSGIQSHAVKMAMLLVQDTDHGTRVSHASMNTISKWMGIDRSTVKKYWDMLVDGKFIDVKYSVENTPSIMINTKGK